MNYVKFKNKSAPGEEVTLFDTVYPSETIVLLAESEQLNQRATVYIDKEMAEAICRELTNWIESLKGN